MPRPTIDRRPKVYCANCFRFVGVHKESRFCDCCGKCLDNNRVNVRELCEANLQVSEEKKRIRAAAYVLDGFIAALGYTFMKLQNFNVVDMAYYTTLILVIVMTEWYIRRYVHPKYPRVYRNRFFKPGIPEAPPPERMGFGDHE